ncbi:MAG: hypothetical protein SF162_08555 [bacterium]|nr:hypothetical protein [bacterium]
MIRVILLLSLVGCAAVLAVRGVGPHLPTQGEIAYGISMGAVNELRLIDVERRVTRRLDRQRGQQPICWLTPDTLAVQTLHADGSRFESYHIYTGERAPLALTRAQIEYTCALNDRHTNECETLADQAGVAGDGDAAGRLEAFISCALWSWSNDGRYLLISINTTNAMAGGGMFGVYDLFLLDGASGDLHRLTHTHALEVAPAWRP